MKKIFTMMMLTAFVSICTAQIPTTGLVAWYPFSGNANDASGNGNNGTVNGATLTADRFGTTNGAYSFDGVNDYIVTNTSLEWKTNNYTYSVWAKLNNYALIHAQRCVMSIGGTNNSDGDQAITNANLYFITNTLGWGCGAYTLPSGGIGISQLLESNLGQWYFITATWSNQYYKLYVNSILVNSLPTVGLLPSYGANPLLRIGERSRLVGDQYFNGVIDDIRIYDRELSQAEITSLYNENLCTTPSPIVQNVTNCGPSSMTLTASGGTVYNWYDSPTGGSVIGNGSTFITPYLTVSDTFWVSNVDTCESVRVAVIAYIMTAHIAQNDTVSCSGLPLTLNIQGSIPNYSYLWSTGDTITSITISPTQTTTYTVTITSGSTSCTDSRTVTVNGSSVTGKLTYDNTDNTSLSCSKIYLKTLAGSVFDSTYTDNSGDYRFCGIPDGSYKLSTKTTKAVDGINSIDALLDLKHYVGNITLTGLRYTAGDVNATGYINSGDALLIAKRYIGVSNTFPIGDWVFEEPVINVTGSSAQVIDFKGICAGDVNGTYIPPACGFTTCGDTLIDSRDGQKYPTVTIGGQCWMKKNLNIGVMVTSTNTGTDHSDCSNNGIIEKYCYNNDPFICSVYGGLYDWNEMMQYTTIEGTQGICPTGWHIPNHSDFSVLIELEGGQALAGGKMKETGFEHWSPPNTGATNEHGFTALGCGFRSPDGNFSNFMGVEQFWESFFNGSYNLRVLDVNSSWCSWASAPATYGYSVRCLKDN